MNSNQLRIWIDIDNSPHVPFFRPIIKKLQNLGHDVVVTARDYAQSVELLDLYGISYHKIGKHPGKHKLKKVIGTLYRSVQLAKFAIGRKFDIAVNHASRSQAIAAFWLRCPYVAMYDYEYVSTKVFDITACKILVPDAISDESLESQGVNVEKVVKYPGFKEQLYIYDLNPDPSIYDELGINPDKIVVTLRPPQTAAHYHVHASDQFFEAVLKFLSSQSNVTIVILSRTKQQEMDIQESVRYTDATVVFPNHAVDGINLLWHSDVVISGGGTMNREAALLGIPTYTIFAGKLGILDQKLILEQKMKKISSPQEVNQIILKKRPALEIPDNKKTQLVDFITNQILTVAHQGK